MTNRDYTDPDYKKWREKIRKRDKHKCQFPNCSSKSKLQVHHILRWQDYPGLRYDPNNGITLCALHHRMVTGREADYVKLFAMIIGKKNG